MAKYNTNQSKAEAAVEAVKVFMRREPTVIPQTKWDNMVQEVGKSRMKIRALKISLAIAIVLNIAALIWILK